jgi:hypothetical protein
MKLLLRSSNPVKKLEVLSSFLHCYRTDGKRFNIFLNKLSFWCRIREQGVLGRNYDPYFPTND